MISPAELDALMHRGWPGLSTVPVDSWLVRLAGGITQRANSVLPAGSPRNLAAALDRVEALYAQHGLPAIFQISPAAQPADLDAILAARGYESRAPTLVRVAEVDAALRRLPPTDIRVGVADAPGEAWMRLWWSIDGRGGLAARGIARRILTSAPALYAAAYDSDGVASVGRLALVDAWGGIYCMAVREDARRQGHGRAILLALLQEGARRGIRDAWLQVVERNTAARALYSQVGFVTASRYHYRVRPAS